MARETVGHAQAEPGTLADVLGGEERIAGVLDDFVAHAGPGIADRQDHVVAGFQLRCAGTALVDGLGRGAEHDPPAIRHGVTRVEGEVQDGAFELAGISHRRPRVRLGDDLDGDGLAENAGEDAGHVIDQRVEIDRRHVEVLLAREGEHALGQVGAAHHALASRLGMVSKPRVLRQVLLQ